MPHSHPASDPASPNTPHPNHPSGSLHTRLAHLRHKHAHFRVKLQIHQVSSIPYVRGEFGLKWKFRNVVSVGPSSGLFAKMRRGQGPHHKATNAVNSGEGKGKERAVLDVEPEIIVHDHDEEAGDGEGDDGWDDDARSQLDGQLGHEDHNPYAEHIDSDLLHHNVSMSPASGSQSSSSSVNTYSDSRGMTSFVKLRDHTVKWEHTVNVVVSIDVQRETGDLLPNELKLVVRQRVIPGDLDAPQNPRLGHVLINLSEYVDAGAVTRNYLLRQSKTNAILKLTIEMEHAGGETSYKAPPLRKGEILAGVTGLLTSNDVYRAPSWLSEQGGDAAILSRRKSAPFDITQITSAYGPKTTENLIEAIFNPVPTASEMNSPFTYYVPKDKLDERRQRQQQLRQSQSQPPASPACTDFATRANDKQSVYSSMSSESAFTNTSAGGGGTSKEPSPSIQSSESVSETSSSAANGMGRLRGNRRWWKRFGGGSRPTTPVDMGERAHAQPPLLAVGDGN